MLVTDGFTHWNENIELIRFVPWNMDTGVDGFMGFTDTGPILMKKGLLTNYTECYVGYCPEWTWFLDFAGVNATHSPYQYHVISQVMKHHPPEVIVELGTAHGALSLYLGVCAAVVGAQVHTFDYDPEQSWPIHHAFRTLGIVYHDLDYLEHRDFVAALLRGRRSYVICDGEHEQKADELAIFAPMITPGSCISVHDYYAEVHDEDIQEAIEKNNLKEFQRSEWCRHAVFFATWVKE